MSDDQKLRNFIKWLHDPAQEIHLHPSLTIRKLESVSGRTGYGVFTEGEIPRDTTIMRVPKTTLLSSRTCGISNLIHTNKEIAKGRVGEGDEEEDGLEGMVACCVAFLFERFRGSEGPWSAYLAQCPQRVSISKLWTRREQEILRGTEVAMVGGTTLRDFQHLYRSQIMPFLDRYSVELGDFVGWLTFEIFCEGMSVVGSRAFEIDGYHGLAMCPFADMLDHSADENVHFETTFEVCLECGGAEGCEHTHDSTAGSDAMSMDGSEDSTEDSYGEETDTCDFTTTRSIKRGQEVLNTYGELSNDVLLARYGFAIAGNPHTEISLGIELSRWIKQQQRQHQQQWKAHLAWWDINGHNLMRALPSHMRSLSSRQEIDHQAEAMMETNRMVNGSERREGAEIQASSAEEEEEEVEEEEEFQDAIKLTKNNLPSSTLLVFLLTARLLHPSILPDSRTNDDDDDDENIHEVSEPLTGPQIKHAVTRGLAAWHYILPGRMPLPRLPATSDDHPIDAQVLQSWIRPLIGTTLPDLIRLRRARYAIPIPDSDAVEEDKTMDERERIGVLVRREEERAMQGALEKLEMMHRASQWVLSLRT